MNIARTFRVIATLAASSAVPLAWSQALPTAEPKDWQALSESTTVKAEDDGIACRGQAGLRVVTVKTVEIDPAKIYRLSGQFRNLESDGAVLVYFGVVPLDAEGNDILSGYVNVVADTQTELAADYQPSDKKVMLKSAEKWQTGPTFHVVFEADDSSALSDLPNTRVSTAGIAQVEKIGDGYEVTLGKPAGKFYAAGTKVREHADGPGAIYAGGVKRPIHQSWEDLTGNIEPEGPAGALMNNWWRGSKKAKIIIATVGEGEVNLLFRNISFDEQH